MFQEFSRELANVINELTRYTHQLAAWRDVVDKLDEKGKLSVAVDFVNPLATIALNLPYVIRSRFIFATAHLSHQATRALTTGAWKDDLPLDREIYFSQADATGKPWKMYRKLKPQLERIGDQAYQDKTQDFRNTYNHRFSPHIVLGQASMVTRCIDPKTERVSYTFGWIPPLTLELVVELLEQQCDHCYKAFERFQKLVREHERAISATPSTS
ncbi:hypothetical protein N5C72_18600 [Achromobacter mucicolens]|uniref:Integrase n=1 Tax=Achromobacter mucicolens TaxID=1389922 RepID=A0ABD4YYQ2_9BURK|nr:hypothetical protein [Achromobacter mucicolens]MDH1180100.1 hypothetical protein [Achromobacter mucicolens]